MLPAHLKHLSSGLSGFMKRRMEVIDRVAAQDEDDDDDDDDDDLTRPFVVVRQFGEELYPVAHGQYL